MKKKLFLLLSLALLSTVPSWAQGFSKRSDNLIELRDSTILLDDVEVTAQRKSPTHLTRIQVPIEKLPISVSAIQVDQLTMRGVFDVQEAIRFMPSANMRTTYGAFQQLSVRGFDHTPVMVDGMRDERSGITNSYPLSDLSDVESIELLKGPASVLQGHSTVGGVLNITRKAPSSKRSLFSRIALASFQGRQATMNMGGMLTKGINYFAGVNYSDGKGWRDRGDKRFKTYAAIATQWANSDLQLRGGYGKDFYGTEIGLPPTLNEAVFHANGSQYLEPGQLQPGIDPANRYNNESDFMYNKNWNVSGKYVYRFGEGMKLTEHASFNYDDIDYFGTEELSYRTSENPIYPYYVMRKDKKVYIDMDSVQLTFPLRFSHKAKTVQNQLSLDGAFYTYTIKHNYSLGYAFSYMRRTSFSGYKLGVDVVGPGLFSVVSVQNPESMGYMNTSFSKATPTHTYSHGIYLQDLVELSEQFQVMAALRYDQYRYERASALAIDGKPEFVDPPSKEYSKTHSQALTYRVGAVCSPQEDLNIYASLANFYQPYRNFFSENNIYINSEGNQFYPEVDGEIFKPKSGYQMELGSRIKLNRVFSAQLVGYYIKQNNITKNLGKVEVEENGQTVSKTIIGQVGTIESNGFEIELMATPTKGLYLTAGYSLTDAKYSKLKKNPYLETDVNEGDPLVYIPKHKFYSYGNYTLQAGALRGFGLHYSLSYLGKTYRNYQQNIYFDGYLLCNVGASYPIYRDVKLSLEVNNLLNAKYYAQALGRQLVPSAPTNLIMSISYKLQ